VTDEHANVLARDGNVAVTQLAGRAFPGVHIQGDTFAELQRQLADAVSQLRHTRDDADAWADLDSAVEELTQMLRFYESVLEEHDVQRPYFRNSAA
jgi:predicted RNase H-like HicB family nuclease